MPDKGLVRVRCLNNAEYLRFEGEPLRQGQLCDLVVGDLYWAAPNLEDGYWRVWDLSGEDYLYPEGYFELAADDQ